MRTLPLWIVALVAVPAAQETTRAPEAQFALAAGEHDLRTVIAAAASYLGRNLLVDAIQGDPKVTLQIGQKLDRDGCFAVVTQLAWTHGLVLVPLDYERGIWEFVPYQGPRRDELRSRAPLLPLDEVRKLAGTRIMVMAVIQLQHLRGSAVAQTLRMISTSQSTLEIGTAGAETSIVVRGFVDEVLNAAEICAAADVPQKDRPDLAARLQEMAARVQQLEARLAALEKKAEPKSGGE